MTDIPREWIEACAREIGVVRIELIADIARVLRPLIEAETRERCAQIAMLHDVSIVGGMEFYDSHSLDIAAAIRASALRAEGE